MYRTFAALPFCLLLASSAAAAEPETPPAPEKFRAVVEVDPDAKGKGIKISCPKEISTSGEGPRRLSITFVNLLEEEIFLTVHSWELKDLGYVLEGKVDGRIAITGRLTGSLFPDNTGLLKRLHACHYDKLGRPRPCGCAVAYVAAAIDVDSDELSEFFGGTATVIIPVKGYFRSTGKEFSEEVEVPLKIVK